MEINGKVVKFRMDFDAKVIKFKSYLAPGGGGGGLGDKFLFSILGPTGNLAQTGQPGLGRLTPQPCTEVEEGEG